MLFRSDRKSTRLNSSHTIISYAVFCLKKKKSQIRAAEGGTEGGASGEPRGGWRRHALRVGAVGAQPRGRHGGVPVAVVFFFKKTGPHRVSPLFPSPRPSR